MIAFLASREENILEIGRHFSRGERSSPVPAMVLFALVVMIGTAWYVWQWRKHRDRQPSSRKLAEELADSLGLTAKQCRLVCQIARQANLEPAAALLSPQLLTDWVVRAEQQGMKLSPSQTLAIGQILDAVTSAAEAPPRHPQNQD